MAALPVDAIIPEEPPFTSVGVDCFGPFQVRHGHALVKRYGVIFTCLAICAVHLEITQLGYRFFPNGTENIYS